MYHKCRSYEIWFLKYKVRQTEIFVILGHFLSFQSPDNPENQNFKTSGDIIILHICAINDNHMIHGSWDMECDRQNFLSFWTVFCLFTPSGPRKLKFWKNEKNAWRCYHFTNINDRHMIHGFSDMECNRQNISLDYFLPF